MKLVATFTAIILMSGNLFAAAGMKCSYFEEDSHGVIYNSHSMMYGFSTPEYAKITIASSQNPFVETKINVSNGSFGVSIDYNPPSGPGSGRGTAMNHLNVGQELSVGLLVNGVNTKISCVLN